MAQRGNRGGRNNTRKPVTIDLEATPDSAEENIVENTENTDVEAVRDAEPVAMDAVENAEDSPIDTAEADDTAPTEPTEEPIDEPAAANAPTTIVEKRGMSALGGGIVGGILALAGAAGLQFTGVLPNAGSVATPAVETAPQVDLSPLEAQIAALQAELETVRSADNGGAATAAVPDDIMAQIQQAVSDAADANARAQAAESDVLAASEQLASLQQSVSSGAAGEGAGLEAIASRMNALEQQMSDVAAAATTAASAESAPAFDPQMAVDAVQPSIDGLNEQLATLGGDMDAIGQTVEGLSGEMAALQQGLTDVTQAQDASAEQLNAMSAQIAANDERLEQSGAGNTVAKAIAASGLRSAADRGMPFMAEIETFASVGGDAEALSSLREFAAVGVPTQSNLVEQFGSVANTIVATGQGLSEDASIADRLMNSARSLVQVRDLNEVEGDSVTAITNRIDTALKADDLDNALAQWETLPDSAKNASTEFADQLRARLTVDMLLNNVLNDAMAATKPSADQ